MEKNKKKIVKAILNNESIEPIDNYEELIDMLVDEPIAINVDKEEKRSLGEKLADKITEIVGSWTFIIIFCLFLLLWMVLNYCFIDIDPYPFILLNLILSCVAAIQAPIIMMSQNRQAAKDSLRNQNDYRTDLKSELILEELHNQMDTIIKNQKKIMKSLDNSQVGEENEKK